MSLARVRPAGSRKARFVRNALIAVALVYVLGLLVAPVVAMLRVAVDEGWSVLRDTFSQRNVRHAYWLTAVITVTTVLVTGVFGVVTAWVLTRHRFVGRKVLDAIVDLPLAVSPVIVGLAAVLLFGRGGWFEPFFAERGIQIIFALPSMILVTIFICIPFVIREVAPVLNELGTEEEEAAQTLGASSTQTFFRVTLRNIRWGLLYGIALSAARALGEIGAVLIVSGNLKGLTETATLYIFTALEERQDASANIVALTLAAISILLLIGIETSKSKRERETST
jgi:sulfate/thiosulfate transport system permease protein